MHFHNGAVWIPSPKVLPPSESAAPVAEFIDLHCVRGAPPLRVALASGRTCQVTAPNAAVCSRLVQEVLHFPMSELLPRAGGLLSNISVLENVVLPAVYHRRIARAQLAELVYEEFEACGLDRGQAEVLCGKAVPDLDEFERRLVALVRSLLMRPAVLIMERIFEGLTAREMERVGCFGEYYRRAVADGTVILFDIAGMPCPEFAADVRAGAE